MPADRADPPPVLVGQSSRIRQILQLIQKLGRSRSPVLILGETGTGKEVVARAIHAAGPPGPFVPIDCSALVGPLIESELFGHVRGAFTGASGSKPGLVEMANGGTALFDEIGELGPEVQAKLLRLIQEKEFRPVGSLERRKADFRVIAATNRDLAQEVEKGTFRRDLYYRLNVVVLRIPPLRERKEDLRGLVDHFLGRYGNRHVLTHECLDAMLSYDWPGNVRELENCIQRMVAINSGPLLHTADLPSALQNALEARRPAHLTAAAAAGHGTAAQPYIQMPLFSLTEMEKDAIIRALEYTRGDRAMAAQLLGIGRTTLYRKLKEYRLAN
ncbi:MAG: sigma-54-dependent Fis family transcriptional regulator [Bryobacterales bacterium]|nr:sigma-54-dependent Fis family transcriptional regulator [Bryobacterales bacterium]